MVGTEVVDQLESSLGPDATRLVAVAGTLRNAAQARPDYALVDGTTLPRVLHMLCFSRPAHACGLSCFVARAAAAAAALQFDGFHSRCRGSVWKEHETSPGETPGQVTMKRCPTHAADVAIQAVIVGSQTHSVRALSAQPTSVRTQALEGMGTAIPGGAASEHIIAAASIIATVRSPLIHSVSARVPAWSVPHCACSTYSV